MLARKEGNVWIAIFPMFTILLIFIIFMVCIIYSQIIIGVVNIRSDIFYIVQNSIIKLNKEELSYGKYIVDKLELEEEISNLLLKNYMLDSSGNKINRTCGILDVHLNEIEYYTEESEILAHTKGEDVEPIIHIVLTVRTKAVLNIGIKDTYDTEIHEDIKLTRLKMF